MSHPLGRVDGMSELARTERELRWASTMSPVGDGPVRRAHVDVNAKLGTVEPFGRVEREAAEEDVLAPGATRAHEGGHRGVEEAPDEWRTCFERDRDRR